MFLTQPSQGLLLLNRSSLPSLHAAAELFTTSLRSTFNGSAPVGMNNVGKVSGIAPASAPPSPFGSPDGCTGKAPLLAASSDDSPGRSDFALRFCRAPLF